MTKRNFLSSALVALLFVLSAPVKAENYGMGGCGLGSMIITGSNGFEQIFVALTNDWTSSNTSGITSGTSNCRDDVKKTANLFFEINKEALKRDVARGEGETLASLSDLLGCANTPALATSLQANYAKLFDATSSSHFMDRVEPVIHGNSAVQCRAI